MDGELLLIRNCTFHNSFALGMCGGNHPTYVKDCESYEQGKPFHNSTEGIHFTTGTVGFCDVEDLQTPIITLENVRSQREKSLLMDGSYTCKLINCTGLVWIYRGWDMEVYGHTGKILTMDNASAPTIEALRALQHKNMYLHDNIDFRQPVNGSTVRNVNVPRIFTDNQPILTDMTAYAHYFDNFIINTGYSVNSYYWNQDDCAPNGVINATEMTDSLRLLLSTKEINPYTGKPTHLIFNEQMSGSAGQRGGALYA